MNLLVLMLIGLTLAVSNQVVKDYHTEPTSATQEEAKGANGPGEHRHDCDQCSARD